VAIETTGVYGKSTAPFLSGLAKKLVDVSGDPRERQWLHQRLSLAVVRGNVAGILICVRASFHLFIYLFVSRHAVHGMNTHTLQVDTNRQNRT